MCEKVHEKVCEMVSEGVLVCEGIRGCVRGCVYGRARHVWLSLLVASHLCLVNLVGQAGHCCAVLGDQGLSQTTQLLLQPLFGQHLLPGYLWVIGGVDNKVG